MGFGRRLEDYIEEARDISRNLPEAIQGGVSKRLIEGLDNGMTQRIVKGQLGKRTKKTLEETIQAVEGADEEDGHRGTSSTTTQELKKFPGLKGSELAIAQMLEEQRLDREVRLEEQRRDQEASAKQMKMLIDWFSGI